MESQGSIGGLIPLWILGAPVLLALSDLFTTPRSTGRRARDSVPGSQVAHPHGAGASPRPVAPGRL